MTTVVQKVVQVKTKVNKVVITKNTLVKKVVLN